MIKKEDLVQRLERLSEHYSKQCKEIEDVGIKNIVENSELRKLYQIRAFYYKFLEIIKTKFPTLTLREIDMLFKAIRNHYQRAFPPIKVLPKYESLLTLNEIKEGANIQTFLDNFHRLKNVKLNGEAQNERGKFIPLPELTILFDEDLLEHIKDSIIEFYIDYRSSSSFNYEYLLHNHKLKNFDNDSRNEFANNCYKSISELNLFEKEGYKMILIYWLLYIFKYINEASHLKRSSEYQPNNSYKAFLKDIIKK